MFRKNGIQRMCILFVMAFLLMSCGSHKSNVKTRSEEQSSVNILGYETLSENESGKVRVEESCDETTIAHRVEYDTAQPVLSSTGKPPVKSEETITRSRKALSNMEEYIQSELTDTSSITMDKDDQVKESVETKQKKVSGGISTKIALTIVSCIILVIVLWLIKRKPH
jgi:hypothetical protein